MTGAPGELDSFVTAWREFTGPGTDSVPSNTAITYTNGFAVGTAVSFTPPSDTVTINEAGYYEVNFTIHNSGDAMGFELRLNGTSVTTLPFTGEGGGPVTGEIIILVDADLPATLQLVNISAPAGTNLHSNTNATLTVKQISTL